MNKNIVQRGKLLNMTTLNFERKEGLALIIAGIRNTKLGK